MTLELMGYGGSKGFCRGGASSSSGGRKGRSIGKNGVFQSSRLGAPSGSADSHFDRQVVVVDHHNKDYDSNFTNQNMRKRESELDQVKRECFRKVKAESASDYEMPLPCISSNGVDIDASRSGSSSGRATTTVHHSPSRCLSGFSFFSDRDEIGGSSSNGRNQDDSLIKHGEYWAQHDELHGAYFNASEVTTGKTNDNTNDGIVEISDDERLDKMEFLSNIWEHVESNDFMKRVCQGLDSRPSSLGGNQAMLIQLPSHFPPLNHDPLISPTGRVGDHVNNDHHGVRPLNHDPLISSARRVGDHVDSDHHGLCVPENMEDSQKV
ncbi:hypothetical protein GOBAR_DD28154 [Gossypium barbadense]|nr:hypothetical protein GOBAR_DD28154 [Gossypium barbadense]